MTTTQNNIVDVYNIQSIKDLQKVDAAQMIKTITRTDVDVIPKTKVDVLTGQLPLSIQKSLFDTKLIPEVTTKQIFKTDYTPLIIPISVYETVGVSPPNQGYDVFVKRRQWKDGRRIRGTEWVKVNKKSLFYNDAINIGSNIVDNTAKASFKVKPSKGKPVKRKTKTYPANEYIQRGNYFVELPEFRIDSKGELREITQRGINANRRKGPTLGVDYNTNRKIKKFLGVK